VYIKTGKFVKDKIKGALERNKSL